MEAKFCWFMNICLGVIFSGGNTLRVILIPFSLALSVNMLYFISTFAESLLDKCMMPPGIVLAIGLGVGGCSTFIGDIAECAVTFAASSFLLLYYISSVWTKIHLSVYAFVFIVSIVASVASAYHKNWAMLISTSILSGTLMGSGIAAFLQIYLPSWVNIYLIRCLIPPVFMALVALLQRKVFKVLKDGNVIDFEIDKDE